MSNEDTIDASTLEEGDDSGTNSPKAASLQKLKSLLPAFAEKPTTALRSLNERLARARQTKKGQILLGAVAALCVYFLIFLMLWLRSDAIREQRQARAPHAEAVIRSAKKPMRSTAPAPDTGTPEPRSSARISGRTPLTAPMDELLEMTQAGALPKIDSTGLEPRRAYAMPFDVSDPRPKVSLIVVGLGLSREVTESALALPPEIGLAFSPYTQGLDDWLEDTRMAGHESYIQLPMEPVTYPIDDPGPHTLLSSLSDEENTRQMHWVMSRGAGYVGLVAYMGSQFVIDSKRVDYILSEIKNRGLLYIDNNVTPYSKVFDMGIETAAPFLQSSLDVDAIPTERGIDQQLDALIEVARKQGQALGLVGTHPLNFSKIALWANTLRTKGVVLAPPTALIQ